ncbi:hypothetical protein BREU_1407 [Bifidobacterium reuteri DSM 23975]|uniref:Uncharacterized protein n=1 Tax=Bifidobacterium reuteri DSM 23975 TaxID=1437610 RepID=A0A087CSI4_9BIFI|nr:hypothetical protein BREU_1407 [Bifidobacterium reuteri DSM 23975]
MSEPEAWARLYALFCRSLPFCRTLQRYDPPLFTRFTEGDIPWTLPQPTPTMIR